jgi:hypothetical protein
MLERMNSDSVIARALGRKNDALAKTGKNQACTGSRELRRPLLLFGHAAAALGELGFLLGADGVGSARVLLLRAAVAQVLLVALLGAALPLPLRGR